jgi:hypothetical protein
VTEPQGFFVHQQCHVTRPDSWGKIEAANPESVQDRLSERALPQSPITVPTPCMLLPVSDVKLACRCGRWFLGSTGSQAFFPLDEEFANALEVPGKPPCFRIRLVTEFSSTPLQHLRRRSTCFENFPSSLSETVVYGQTAYDVLR